MINFKEIAEKCLAGELSGTFIFQNGQKISSSKLRKFSKDSMHDDYIYYFKGVCTLDHYGFGYNALYNIINFISDNMQKLIKIDVPEGKVPVMEQTESGVVITWKEKELTYDDIVIEQAKTKTHVTIFSYNMCATNPEIHSFYKKVEVLRKLTNIRNYFGKHNDGTAWFITRNIENKYICCQCLPQHSLNHTIFFATKEHAQAAINMLGDELKYLFEPW